VRRVLLLMALFVSMLSIAITPTVLESAGTISMYYK